VFALDEEADTFLAQQIQMSAPLPPGKLPGPATCLFCWAAGGVLWASVPVNWRLGPLGWLLLAAFALLGHGLLWSTIVALIHAADLPRKLLHPLTAICFVLFLVLPVVWVGWWAWIGWPTPAGAASAWNSARVLPAAAYLVLCMASGVIGLGRLAWHRLRTGRPNLLRRQSRHALQLDLPRAAQTPDELNHHPLVWLPGNEILQLELVRRTIALPHLPEELDGLSIVHLSDFHFTGRVGKAYFREVVARANELRADLVAVTGDLADHQQWIEWIPEILGGLSAPCGVYAVLGNHDARVDPQRIREAVRRAGLVDLGSRWLQIELRGRGVILAGNELPWLAPAADLSEAPPPAVEGGPLRIALGHSPDQIGWARQNHVDLFLVGHTHGGQIRLPLLGTLVTPSRYGLKYTAGVFHEPPTVMHVTQGVSGELPVRWNCRPELCLLVLQCETARGTASQLRHD